MDSLWSPSLTKELYYVCDVYTAIKGIATIKSVSGAKRATQASAEAAKGQAESQKKQAYGQAFNFRQRAKATEFNIRVSEENKRIAGMAMEDIRHQGREAIANRQLKGRQVQGTQLAQMANSGFLALSGNGGRILQDTMQHTQQDVATIFNNMNKSIYEKELDIWSRSRQEDLMRLDARNDRINAVFAEATGVAAANIGAQVSQGIRSSSSAQKWAAAADLWNTFDNYYNRQV